MDHTLIYTIIAGVVFAFIFGFIAKKLKLPAIFGYLIAGIAIGPYTPGFVADTPLAQQLAEIGIILLMFDVGLHFSLKDLLSMKNIVLPSALIQMAVVSLAGTALGYGLGFQLIESFVFGIALSVASTIVLIRGLEQNGLSHTRSGKIAMAWLVVEDIVMVLILVMLPIIAEMLNHSDALNGELIARTFFSTLLKIGGFFALMLVLGRRFIPFVLKRVKTLNSAEFQTLGTLAVALGFGAIAYLVFDASLALGAFLAGMMLNESEIGQEFAQSCSQIRDTFSVLFFVSVGMLFNPWILTTSPLALLLTFFIIVLFKGAVAYILMRLFKQSTEMSVIVALGLSQIGEFSFILGSLAHTKGLMTQEVYSLILGGAILSIVLNPFLFRFWQYYSASGIRSKAVR